MSDALVERYRIELRRYVVGPWEPDFKMWHCRACNCIWPSGDPRERHNQNCLAQPSESEVEIGLKFAKDEGMVLK